MLSVCRSMVEHAPSTHGFLLGMGRGFHSGSVKRPQCGNYNTNSSCFVFVLMIVLMVYLSLDPVATKLLQVVLK